jgi:hypothetical protein
MTKQALNFVTFFHVHIFLNFPASRTICGRVFFYTIVHALTCMYSGNSTNASLGQRHFRFLCVPESLIVWVAQVTKGCNSKSSKIYSGNRASAQGAGEILVNKSTQGSIVRKKRTYWCNRTNLVSDNILLHIF